MLSLDDLCKSVQTNVREALAREKLIQARLAAKGKIQPEQQFQNGQPKSQLDEILSQDHLQTLIQPPIHKLTSLQTYKFLGTF